MDPKPFTYEHFIQAVQSLKDDMLMYYIDEAVAIYCRIKGKSVGPRPASSKDYLPEYADAFEAANYAIFITANKIGAYNPDKGAFRPYLRKALESALRDIFRVDGYETLSGSSEIENEPDTSASDAEERVRQHKDDAFETMIKFIDALPEIKRAAIYASAFGQILRPDLEGYGRNYADILADIYHTTALYIRQLATEGKKAALAEARRQGFSESSMNEVYMGMLQVQSTARDINDEVLQATEKLSPYQQFMLLRHLAVKEENDNNINTMTFEYKPENATLTPSQEALLGQIEDLPCPFDGIKHLKDLRDETGVTVVVADKAHFVNVLDSSIKKISEQIISSHEMFRSDATYGERKEKETKEDLFKRSNWAEEQLHRVKYNQGHLLLGLYSRKLLWFDDAEPKVFLFADNIRDYAKSKGCNEDNVFGYVYIHEMMHAYYDAFESKGFPSREPLEEAFAEYGMLTFINNSTPGLRDKLLADASKHVESKIGTELRQYGFGFDMFKITKGGDVDLVNLYMRKSNKIDLEVIRNWESDNKYFEDIKQYPKPVDADKCFKGVKEILHYDWKEPCFVIQPSISGSHSTSVSPTGFKHGPFPVMPMLYRTKEWAVTASKINWHFQYPLIKTNDLVQLMAEVIRVMKNEGFESYLSFASDRIVFLGRLFSFYDSAILKYSIPESINVKGSVVYPRFKRHLLGGPAGQVGNILYALGTLLDGTFTLVHEGSDFVLYGPDSCVELFEKATHPNKGTGYTIIEKATSRILGNERFMNHVPLFIVKDYCSRHPSKTCADLKKIFSSVEKTHLPEVLDSIELEANAKAYYDGVKADDSENKRYFYDESITLSSREVILVTTQWSSKDNFNDFIRIAEGLGYIIK